MPEVIDVLRLSRDGRFVPQGLEFTAIDFETSALHPGHVIEVAAVRTTADGTVLDELSTLVNPGPGISPGPVRVHGISRDELDSAPGIADAFAFLADFLRDGVLVAHNLAFEERFLRRELDRCGVRLTGLPGVCTLATARETLRLPNYRLATVTRSLGLEDFPAHTALGDARACARVATTFINAHGLALGARPRFVPVPRFTTSRAPTPRRDALPVTVRAWTAELPERIPTAAGSTDPAVAEAYLDMLGIALADQHISAEEAAALTRLAADAGLTREDLRRIHTGFVEGMRTIAEADGILTTAEVADLKAVASALRVPELVAGLRPTGRAERPTRVLVLGQGPDAHVFRAAVLTEGLQLARRLTPSVTHLVASSDVARTEPRLARAADLGILVLDLDTARTLLLPSMTPPQPALETAARQPKHLRPAPSPPPRPAPAAPVPRTAPLPLAHRHAFPLTPEMPVRSSIGLGRWAGWAITGLGLVLAVVAAVTAFGGVPFAAGLVFFLLGAGLAVGGWYLGERWD